MLKTYNKFLLVCVYIVINSCIKTQVVNYSNPAYEIDQIDKTNYYIIGKIKENILIIKNTQRGVIINVYNENLGIKNSIRIREFNENIKIVDAINCIDNFILLYILKNEKYKILYGVAMNDTGVPISETILIDTIFNNNDSELIKYFISENKKNIICSIIKKEEDTTEINSIILNNEMQILKKNSFKIQSLFDINKTLPTITNNGICFLFYQEKKNLFKLIRWQSDNDSVWTRKLNFNINSFEEINYKINNFTNNLLFYNLKKNNEGVLMGIVNQNYNINSHIIEEPNIISLSKKNITNIDNANLPNINITEVFISRDSSVLFITEQNLQESYQEIIPNNISNLGYRQLWSDGFANINSNNIRINKKKYYSNDIFIFKTKNNNLLLHNSIIKRQEEKENDNLISHFVLNNGFQLHFLYNNFMFNGSVLLNDIYLLPKGELNKLAIVHKLKKSFVLLIKNSKQIDPNTIIIPCYVNNILCFSKINLSY